MTTLTLQQLRQLKRVQAVTDKPLHFFFTEITPVNAILIEHLLFRTENHGHPVTFYLLDHSTVTLRDVATGVFINDDVGQSRSLVLLRRYSGFFQNITLSVAYTPAIDYSTSLGNSVQRFFFLKTGDETSVIRSAIQNFLNNHPTDEKTFFFRQGITSEGSVVAMQIYTNGVFYGAEDSIETVRTNTNSVQQYVQNSLMAQRTFGMINELISEGGSVSYYELKGDIVFGQVNPSYLLGQLWDGFVSKYAKMYEGLATTPEIIRAVSTTFDEFISLPENARRVEEAKTRLQGRLEDVAHAQLGYLNKTLMRYRETLEQGSDEYRKVIMCSRILMQLGQASAKDFYGENYLNIILMFILFTKENIYHDDIF